MNGKAWAAQHMFASRQDDPAASLRHWLIGLVPGKPWTSGELTLVPLTLAGEPGSRDVLLPEAIAQGELELVEQGSGVVQQVLARNRGARDVLVLEGDTLVGCRQNRMVAWTVIVAARSAVPVSVGCMERGRWSTGGLHFAAGEMTVDPHVRRRTKRETNATAASLGGPRLDQGRAWSDIDGKLGEWSLFSPSADYHSGLARRAESSRRRVQELQPVPGQVGVVALHGDRLLGMEVVGHPDTWRALAGRVLPSYVLGAESARRDPEFHRVPPLPDATAWLAALARSAVEQRRAAGKGVDLILRGDAVSGSCLWEGGAVRHMAVFAR
jgi:hypothetical protein